MQRNQGKGTSASSKTSKNPSKDEIIDSNSDSESDSMEVDNSTNPFPNPPYRIQERDFDSADVVNLAEDEHSRYMSNAEKVGHAFITTNEKGEMVALQYQIPEGDPNVEGIPVVKELHDIREFTKYGLTRFRAQTPDGTEMFCTRPIDGEFGKGEDATKFIYAPMSPLPEYIKEKGEDLPFLGSKNEIPVFKADNEIKNKIKLKDHKKHLADIEKEGKKIKGGKEYVVDHESVAIRETNNKRNPDQNKVMEHRAIEAYQDFLEMFKDVLSDKFKKILQEAVKADLHSKFGSNKRPEWLHAVGFSLTNKNDNPQVKDNLGAGPKWANTHMMVLERVLKWFALHRPNSYLTLKPEFEMLLDSELIKRVKFEITVEEKNQFVKLLQDLDPFSYKPYPKASDLMQLTAGVYSMIHGVKPSKEDKVKTNKISSKNNGKTNGLLAAAHGATSTMKTDKSKKTPETSTTTSQTQPIAPIPIRATAPQQIDHDESSDDDNMESFPTTFDFERSLVQTSLVGAEYDYDQPFNAPVSWYAGGTGFIVEHNGVKYVVTNAHCVENAKYITVRFANQHKVYEAKVKNKQPLYQCDLALLEIIDKNYEKFQKYAVPVEIGDMVALRQQVETIGFPMGGNEISISKGITSRIEVRDYCVSGFDMLQVQIDAAVNSGNSGGPVFSGKKVVGVAFQAYDLHGLAYMIPAPIIHHFLNDAFNNEIPKGFPILPITFETLENRSLRKRRYKLKSGQSGVVIDDISPNTDAHKKLKIHDVLLEIDGYKIQNDGKVDMPEIGNRIDMLHVTHMKYVGDTIKLKILRKNETTRENEIHEINVILDAVPGQHQKVPPKERDKMPTCYVNSGIQFQPLTPNLLEGKASDLDDITILGKGRITEIDKENPDDQFVVITKIYDCKEHEGYLDGSIHIVKSINGKTINNMHDVIAAMEGPVSDEYQENHEIITAQKKQPIVIRRWTREETLKLLKERFQIEKDRSDDLLPARELSASSQAKPQAAVATTTTTTTTSSKPVSKPKEKHHHSSSKHTKHHVVEVDSSSDEDNEINDDDRKAEDLVKTIAKGRGLPGARRYLAQVNAIGEKYAALARHEKDDDDIEVRAYDEDSDDDEHHSFSVHGSDASSADDSYDEVAELKKEQEEHNRKHANKGNLGFFKPGKVQESKNNKKRDRSESIEEDDVPTASERKRQKR